MQGVDLHDWKKETCTILHIKKRLLLNCPSLVKLTPAFSATLASSAVVTSIIIPPLAICANPALTLKVPVVEKQNYAHEMMLTGQIMSIVTKKRISHDQGKGNFQIT